MADWEDVRRIALSLPDADERSLHGLCSWRVRDKPFVWERPLRPADLRALGEAAPTWPILGARVEHLAAKEALLADDPAVFFRSPISTATRLFSCALRRSRSTSSRN
jgi:hypothetical protein